MYHTITLVVIRRMAITATGNGYNVLHMYPWRPMNRRLCHISRLVKIHY